MESIKSPLRDSKAEQEEVDNGQQIQKQQTPLMVNFFGGHIFTVACTLDGKATSGIVDSGAQLTVVSSGLLKKLGIRKPLKRTQMVSLQMASGAPSAPKGKFQGQIQLKGRTFLQEIFVLDTTHDSLLLLGTDFSFNARLVIDFYDQSVSFRDEYGGENQHDGQLPTSEDEGFPANEDNDDATAQEIRLGVYRPPRPISPMDVDPPFAEAPPIEEPKMAVAECSKNKKKLRKKKQVKRKNVNVNKITKELAKFEIAVYATTKSEPKIDVVAKRRRVCEQ